MDQPVPSSVLVRVLVGSGLFTIAVGVVLALTVDPILAVIALVGLIDFGLARAYATGKLGRPESQLAEDSGSTDASQDPSYNPYARDD